MRLIEDSMLPRYDCPFLGSGSQLRAFHRMFVLDSTINILSQLSYMECMKWESHIKDVGKL